MSQQPTTTASGHATEVTRYTLTASLSNIEFADGLDGRWPWLQAEVAGGQTLRFRRRIAFSSEP